MEKITIDHPDSQSADLVAQHIDKLGQLFPEVIKEGKVDFEALQDLLGNYIDTPEERFQLNWAGKAQARREAQKRSTGTLRPCPDESVHWGTTENLYIEGDNLEVLKLLQKSYYKKVKMIYIDPPYNTGKDFVYKDNYSDNLTNYLELTGQDRSLGTNTESDGRYHSNWLNMMYPRLKLARNLLANDGVIFVSIDEIEYAKLRAICDEIFGEENHIADFVWHNKKGGGNDSKHVAVEHEYIVLYAKSKNELGELFIPYNPVYLTRYKEKDEKGSFYWDTFKRKSGKQYYPIICPDGTILEYDDLGNPISWLRSQTRFKDDLQKGEIRFLKINNKWSVQFKQRLPEGKKPRTIFLEDSIWDDVGTTSDGSEEVLNYFEKNVFNNPKPVELIKYIIGFNTKEKDIALDFFSGSGTTAEAVMRINSNDSSIKIKYILVQLPQKIELASDKNNMIAQNAIEVLKALNLPFFITELAKERIRRAGKKILEEFKIKQAKEGALFADEPEKLDIGFKVFKLDSSNINTWDSSPSNLEGALYNSVQNIKSDRTEHDLLYEILLKYGIDLVQPINEHVLAGKKVYEMGAGALIVCMADHVKPEVAEAIAQLWKDVKPTAVDESSKAAINCRVVFKDNGFDDNNDKTNVLQILKQHGIDNIVTI